MADACHLKFLLATFAGWVNRHQAMVIDYLVAENRVLKERLLDKPTPLTDDQRRRLAAKAKSLGRRLLAKFATIVTPNTILRWHRKLVAQHRTYPHKNRAGRPGLMKAIRELIVRMATENAGWGYLRIQGELKKVGHNVARTTIANTLKANGIAPSPNRPTSRKTFLKSQADVIAAADFFTVDVWTKRGLVTHYLLFVVHHATRAVEIAGVTTNPQRLACNSNSLPPGLQSSTTVSSRQGHTNRAHACRRARSRTTHAASRPVHTTRSVSLTKPPLKSDP